MTFSEFVERVMAMDFTHHGRTYEHGDCWAVVWLFYRDVLETELPLYDTGYMTAGETPEDRDNVGAIMARERVAWISTTAPRLGDVPLLRCGGRSCHVGVMLDSDRFVHIEDRRGAMVESLSSPLWRRRLEGVYRHAG